MTELNGTLQGIGLRPLLSFLEGLRNSGSLVVEDGAWAGTLMLTEGQLVGAKFGSEQGLAALDAIFFALPRGRFTFSSDIGACEVNIVLNPGALSEHLEEIGREAAQLMATVPSLGAIPHILQSNAADGEDGPITMGRRSLRLLLALDGRRNVASLAKERGVLRTLRELAELTELGLVAMDGAAMHSPPVPESAPLGGVEQPPDVFGAPSETQTVVNGDRRPRLGWEAQGVEQRRRTIEPAPNSAAPPAADPARNGTPNGRRFFR
jgi:hypothetical protein